MMGARVVMGACLVFGKLFETTLFGSLSGNGSSSSNGGLSSDRETFRVNSVWELV